MSLTVHVATEEAGHSEEAKHQRHSVLHTFHKQFILNHVGLLCCRMQKLGVQNLYEFKTMLLTSHIFIQWQRDSYITDFNCFKITFNYNI